MQSPLADAAATSTTIEGPWRVTEYSLYDFTSTRSAMSMEEPASALAGDRTADFGELGDGRLSAEVLATIAPRCMGTAIAGAKGEWPRDEMAEGAALGFSFRKGASGAEPDRWKERGAGREPPLVVDELPFEGAGVGHTVWEAAIVLALYLRSGAGAEVLRPPTRRAGETTDPRPRVLELGAGIGLPGRDVALRGAASSVTLTDARPALLEGLAGFGAQCAAAGGRALASPSGMLLPTIAGRPPPAEGRSRSLDWHDAADVAAAAAEASYDLAIGSDVAYYAPDVAPLAAALQALAPRAVLVAPAHREAGPWLIDALEARGAAVAQHAVTLARRDGDSRSAGRGRAAFERAAIAYRILAVTWQPSAE